MLGLLVAPDGRFFLYEWCRPYDWTPEQAGTPVAAALRKQTLLYKVLTPLRTWLPGAVIPQIFLHPAPGATYYLGALSPDSSMLSLHELNRDDNQVRGDAVSFDEANSGNSWLTPPPDEAPQMNPPIWMSDGELVYPVKG